MSAGRSAFLSGITRKSSNGPTVLKSADSFSRHREGSYPDEFKGLSIGKLLRGYVTGDYSGAAREMKAMGSTPTSAGGMMIPTPLAAQVIDLARNQARLLQAGAITVPMESATLKYARLTGDVAASWTLEAANITPGAGTFDSVTFTAHKLGALVVIDNELLEDAVNADAIIENSIAQSLALALDAAGLYGSGVAPNPQGLHGLVPTVANGGAYTNFDKYLNAIALVRAANFEPTGLIYSPRTADSQARLKTGIVSDQTPLRQPDAFAALAKFQTNQVSNILGVSTNESQSFVGQFDQLALGLRSTLQIEVSREAGYYDGSAQQSAFSKDQTVIRAILRADWQPLHLGAFAEITGILAQ